MPPKCDAMNMGLSPDLAPSLSRVVEFEDIQETASVMRRQESTSYLCHNYLSSSVGSELPSNQNEADEKWRQRICEWMFSVVDHFEMNREIVTIAMSYLDRFASKQGCCKESYQLAAMTSLQLAIKIFASPRMRLSTLVKLGHGFFTEQDIEAMEMQILTVLRWLVHPPTPVSFIQNFVRLLPSIPSSTKYIISEVSTFITELSVCDYSFITQKPSTIAYAAMLIAMDALKSTGIVSEAICMLFFHRMSSVVGLRHDSYELLVTRDHLQAVFDQSTDFHALLNTIDPDGALRQSGVYPAPFKQDYHRAMRSPTSVAQPL